MAHLSFFQLCWVAKSSIVLVSIGNGLVIALDIDQVQKQKKIPVLFHIFLNIYFCFFTFRVLILFVHNRSEKWGRLLTLKTSNPIASFKSFVLMLHRAME